MTMTLPKSPAIDLSKSHGPAKHRSSAVIVRECLDRGPISAWENKTTGRRARVCRVGSVYGIQIIELGRDGVWHEVTCFVKSKMNRPDQVSKYLRNTGYQPI
jgi:hypothetical protein